MPIQASLSPRGLALLSSHISRVYATMPIHTPLSPRGLAPGPIAIRAWRGRARLAFSPAGSGKLTAQRKRELVGKGVSVTVEFDGRELITKKKEHIINEY